MYHNQIVHLKLCFSLFILHNNLVDNQGSEINNNDIFCAFRHTVFYENFLPTLLYYIYIYMYIYIYIYIYIILYYILHIYTLLKKKQSPGR